MLNNKLIDMLFEGVYKKDKESFECVVWACANIIGAVGSYVKNVFEARELYNDLLNNYEFHRLDKEIESSMALLISNSLKDSPFCSKEIVS